MRTTILSWAAALATFALNGSFAIAEVAPTEERPRYYFPKHIKRQFTNDSTHGERFQDGPTARLPESPYRAPRPEEVLASLKYEGELPTASAGVYTTTYTTVHTGLYSAATLTYTLTYTEEGPTTTRASSTYHPSTAATSSRASTGFHYNPSEGGPTSTARFRPSGVSSTHEPLNTNESGFRFVPDSEDEDTQLSNSRNSSTLKGPIIVGLNTIIESTTYIPSARPLRSGTPRANIARPTSAVLAESRTTSNRTTSTDDYVPFAFAPTGSRPYNSANSTSTRLTTSADESEEEESEEDVPRYVTITGTGGTYTIPYRSATGSGYVPTRTEPAAETEDDGEDDEEEEPTVTDSMPHVTSAPDASSLLSALASSLSSELSSIAATATDESVSISIAAGFSRLLSSAASSLEAKQEYTSSRTATSVTYSPSGTGGAVYTSSYSLSTSSGPDGTTAIPVPITTEPVSDPSTVDYSRNRTTTTTTESTEEYYTTDTAESSYYYSSASETEMTTSTSAPHSILPTGTDSATTLEAPTIIVYAPATTQALAEPTSHVTANEVASAPSRTSTTSAGFPTYMPRLIQAPGGLPTPQPNFTLVQVGFNFGLNFQFVVSQENATSQIFTYLPRGIGYGLAFSDTQVVMNALMPYDTSASLGYITTLAQAWIPSDMVNALQQGLHAPQSLLYQNPDVPVKTLMDMINPAIPLLPGAALDGGRPNAAAKSPAGPTAASPDGAPIGGDSGNSQPVKGSSVGIGVGAVCGAAVYAAAMVYVARRYRNKKRSRHTRNISAPTVERGMSQVSGGGMGGYFMSGANGRGSGAPGSNAGSGRSGRSAAIANRNSEHSSNGRSVRDLGISNPMMAENSLGWN